MKNNKGWEMVKLGEVCEIISGFSFKSEHLSEEGVPLLRISNIKDGNIVFDKDTVFLESSFINSHENFIVKKGDILIALSGATTGKFGEYNLDNICLLNQRVCLIRARNDINQKYLFYNFNILKQKIENIAQGAAQPNISAGEISNLLIPLPPLPEQQRIAALLDAADALRRKDKALLQKYEELAQSVFMDMFGDPVKNEKGWEVVELGETISNLQIGPFGTQLHESDYVLDGIPVINPMHIKGIEIEPNLKYSISLEKYEELPQYHLKKNDVIIGRRGEMGRCALIKNDEKMLCGTGSLFLTTNAKKMNPLFLVYFLSHKSTRKALENSSAGTTMSNLNKNIINTFRVILPNISQQNLFEKSVLKTEAALKVVNKNIKHSETLFASLLQEAFGGS